jgi:glutamine amidotransferase
MAGTVIVNYGSGNIGSVANMLRRIGDAPSFSSDPEDLTAADRIILPGVGAFDACMAALRQHDGLSEAIHQAVAAGVPLLGICVGMQMLAEGSEEGSLPGLGLIPGRVVAFTRSFAESSTTLPVPHMNWCVVDPARDSPLFPSGTVSRFYFVHSYHFVCEDQADVLVTAEYGIRFTAGVQKGTVYGVQFHPEKSHSFGFEFFGRFIQLSRPQPGSAP